MLTAGVTDVERRYVTLRKSVKVDAVSLYAFCLEVLSFFWKRVKCREIRPNLVLKQTAINKEVNPHGIYFTKLSSL